MSITGYWQYEYGQWDEKYQEFRNRVKSVVHEKELDLEVEKRENNEDVLHFRGGPTGYESYYLQDLKNIIEQAGAEANIFCICGGTINSWARCWVKIDELKTILQKL